jgi:hypothetical protein
MTKRKALTTPESEALDLLPGIVARQRTDDLLRNLLASPPAPFTPKPKPATKRAKKRAK